MKKIIFLSLSALLLAGCGIAEDLNQVSPVTQLERNIDIKNTAEKNINDAMSKENERLSETIGETKQSIKTNKNMSHTVTIKTNKGEIKFQTYDADAPKTVENFITLANKKFYDGVIFHRVIDGFMIQGGDPDGVGTGGPGYTVPAEIKRKNNRRTVATARLGDQMNPKKASSGSQFFINVADNEFLDGEYTVFGEVIEGMAVVDAIAKVAKNSSDKPLTDVVMQSVTVETVE